MKVLNPISGFPAWGSNKGTGNPLRIWPWRPEDLITRLSQDWGKQRFQSWRAQQNLAWTKTQRKRAVTPTGEWTCGGMVWQGFTTGMGVPVWEGPLWHKPSWQSPLTTQPVNLRLGSPQAKNNTRKGPQYHLSSVQSCPTLSDPKNCSTPGLPIHHHLPKLAQTHVHWVGDAIQPSHPLSSPSPPPFNLSQHQGLFQWVSSLHFNLIASLKNLSPNKSHSEILGIIIISIYEFHKFYLCKGWLKQNQRDLNTLYFII